VGAGFLFQELDPLSQRGLAGAEAASADGGADPRFKPTRRHAQVERPGLPSLLPIPLLTDHIHLGVDPKRIGPTQLRIAVLVPSSQPILGVRGPRIKHMDSTRRNHNRVGPSGRAGGFPKGRPSAILVAMRGPRDSVRSKRNEPQRGEIDPMSQRIVLRTGEALVEGSEDHLCAEPEIVIGALDGPVGQALATLLGDQTKGHSRVFAILNSDVQVRPATLMVSKVTVKNNKYTNILMGTVQAAIAHGVLDAVREGVIPKDQVNDLGIIYSVWLDPAVIQVDALDHKALFAVHREATLKVIRKALNNAPSIDWLLENQDNIEHYYHKLGVDGEL
jgi:formaldehyde-activating enzyme